jgi:hypothetical protein
MMFMVLFVNIMNIMNIMNIENTMKQYKFSLDKGSKKFFCPKCNKRTFVKYIDTETGSYLNDEFGRCDSETNCGYHSTPKGEIKNTFEVIIHATARTKFSRF